MKIITSINTISEWVGKIFSPVILIIMTLAVYEVVQRYFFSSPTTWVWEINSQLLCVMGAMAGCYTFLKGSHVSVDMVTSSLSAKARARLRIMTFPVFLLFVGCLVWFGTKEAVRAYNVNLCVISQFASPLWPVKAIIPLGGALVLLQGVANLIVDLQIVFRKEK